MARTNTNSGGGGGGTIIGGGASPQVAYWNGANSITGDNNFTWNAGTNQFSVGDLSGTAFNTRYILNDLAQQHVFTTTGELVIENPSSNQFFKAQYNAGNPIITLGDITSVGNDTLLIINDAAQGITGSAVTAGAGGSFFSSATGSGVLYTTGIASWGFQSDATGGGRTSIIANNITWAWPNSDSTGTQALVSNGAGVLSWSTIGTGTVTGSGTSPRIPYWNSATALIDDSNFTRLVNRGMKLVDGAAQNVFIGDLPGNLSIAGTVNVAIGVNTGQSLSSGSRNVFIGENTGFETTTSGSSTYIGTGSGRRMRADECIAIGYEAMFGSGTPANNTGQRNIALGRSTLTDLTSGQNNIAIGYAAGSAIANGAENIMIGQSAGQSIVATSGNTFIGNSNSTTRTSGNNNTIIGASAGAGVGTGATNAGLGYNSFPSLTSGANNVAIGAGAGATLTTGSDNTLVGPSTATATAGTSGAIALGYQATAAANEFALPDSITKMKFQGDSYTLPTAFPAANDQAMVSSTAGVMTWGPVISSGFYTPTLTNVTNVAASTVYDAQWMRIGNVVTVGGRVEVDPSAGSTLTELGISLPIASDIQGLEGVVGTAFSSTVQQGAAIQGDAANNRAQMTFDAATTANANMYYTYIYTII